MLVLGGAARAVPLSGGGTSWDPDSKALRPDIVIAVAPADSL